jgi:hypothetical protein
MKDLYRKLRSFIIGIRQKLSSEGFSRTYGRHILMIESLLVIIVTLTFVIQIFLPAYIIGVSLVAWLIGFFMAIFIHQSMFRRIAEKEICPYEILRQMRFRSYLFKAVILGFLIFFLLLYVWASSLAGKILTDFRSGSFLIGFLQIMLVIEVIGIFFIVTFPVAFSAYFLYLVPIHNNKKARLMFRTALVGLALIRNERKKTKRTKLVGKYVTWFRDGLRLYNKYLYETNPTRLEIANTDSYYRNVCCVASMGNPSEQTIVLDQLRLALSSIAGKYVKDDSRRFLVALKNICNVRRELDYPSDELYKMIRPKPFSDRIKDWLKSPYFEAIVGLIPVIAAVFSIMSILHII